LKAKSHNFFFKPEYFGCFANIALKFLSCFNNLLSLLGTWKNETFSGADILSGLNFVQRGPFQFKIEKLHVFIPYHPLNNDFLINLSQ